MAHERRAVRALERADGTVYLYTEESDQSWIQADAAGVARFDRELGEHVLGFGRRTDRRIYR